MVSFCCQSLAYPGKYFGGSLEGGLHWRGGPLSFPTMGTVFGELVVCKVSCDMAAVSDIVEHCHVL